MISGILPKVNMAFSLFFSRVFCAFRFIIGSSQRRNFIELAMFRDSVKHFSEIAKGLLQNSRIVILSR